MKLTDFDIDNEPMLSCDFKNSLKHTTDFDDMSVPYFDRLAVLVGEGLASEQEKIEYHKMIYSSSRLRTEAEAYSKCHLDPNERIEFQSKELLKHRPRAIALWANIAAAAALAGIGIFAAARMEQPGPEPQISPIIIADNTPTNPPASSAQADTAKQATPSAPKPRVNKNININNPRLSDNGDGFEQLTPEMIAYAEPQHRDMEGEMWQPSAQARLSGPLDATAQPAPIEPAYMVADYSGPKAGRLKERLREMAGDSKEKFSSMLGKMETGLASTGKALASALPIKVKPTISQDGKIEAWNIEGFSRTLTYAR